MENHWGTLGQSPCFVNWVSYPLQAPETEPSSCSNSRQHAREDSRIFLSFLCCLRCCSHSGECIFFIELSSLYRVKCREELKQKPWRNTADRLVSGYMVSNSSYTAQGHLSTRDGTTQS